MKWNPLVTGIYDLKISGFVPHTDVTKDGILFSVVVPEGVKASLLLYEKGSEEVKCEIPFPDEPALGRVFAMLVSGIPAQDLEYNYRFGGRVVTDPSAQIVAGLERYADRTVRREHQIRGAFLNPSFDWGDKEKRLCIPYSESVFYELHVRGFTKSPSSNVKNRGTFLGITEKIPYLSQMGITAVVLMPCYEFDEVMPQIPDAQWRPEGLRELAAGASLPESALTSVRQDEALAPGRGQDETSASGRGQDETLAPGRGQDETSASGRGQDEALASVRGQDTASSPDGSARWRKRQEPGMRVNYWGFGSGWFFAPKRSYCATDNPADEFRTMVKLLHEAGIEVIMEISCPDGMDPSYMQACFLWWRQIYHVDGFMILATQDDVNAVAKSPALSDTKLISDYFDTQRMYPKGRPYRFRNLAEYNSGFRYDARRFLKGDSGLLRSFVSRCRYNPKNAGVINAITGHDGATLFDLVSYNDKHNEANGENNRDGAPYEYSWNCGVEGKTRKKEIMRLRLRQIKNALAMVMLAQGTPMLCAGDEMLNSQDGNTNPYCIDSQLSWVRWSSTKDALEISEYVKKLIALRRTHPLLRQNVELTGSSMGGFFPDFSCHGSNAWFASFDQQERCVGMMYCTQVPDREEVLRKETERRKAARKKRGKKNIAGQAVPDEGETRSLRESYLYVGYNLHWEERQLALPALPAGREWQVILDTSIDRFSRTADTGEGDGPEEKTRSVRMPGRSIRVLEG